MGVSREGVGDCVGEVTAGDSVGSVADVEAGAVGSSDPGVDSDGKVDEIEDAVSGAPEHANTTTATATRDRKLHKRRIAWFPHIRSPS